MKENRRTGILFSSSLSWSDLDQEAVVHLQLCQTGISKIIQLYRDPRDLAKGCINNRKFGAKSKHAYRSPTKKD